MRCSICDYSRDSPSEYFGGLHLLHSRYNKVRVDAKTGDFICSLCDYEVRDTNKDFQYEDDAVGRNTQTVPMR